MPALAKRARPYGIPLALTALVGALAIHRVLTRAGEPAVPLDDAFIHLQYARRLAEGAWFEYTPGAGYSSGATSVLWPLLLAPLSAVGVEGVQMIWGTWLLGGLAHAAVVLETARLAGGLAGRRVGWMAGAMAVAFGAFAWFAYSGMETMALAWVLARGARVASELREPGRPRPFSAGPPPSPWQLVALGLIAPLVRPEGALVSLMAVLTGLASLRDGGDRNAGVARALLPILGPTIVPAMHLAFTGHAVSSTAMVKWLGASPYLDAAGVLRETWANVRVLFEDVLDGGDFSSAFLPEHFVVVVAVGVPAALWFAQARGRRWRFLMLALLLLGTLGPCTYETMLWNRVRYVYPFAPGWLVCAACACALVGELAGRFWKARATVAIGPALAGALVALFAVRLDAATTDLSLSARAIARQHVALGRWAHDALPEDARVGVNDTGAIAYLSDRRTFDVVGLTTEGEAPFWAAGPGARFEHYEHLGAGALPTHLIVYPHWMAMPVVLGRPLVQATVLHQTILGGPTMTAFEADWSALGSGDRPRDPPDGELVDALDVADLGDERAHAYALGDARQRLCVVRTVGDVADGGRSLRAEERFELAGGGPATLVVRLRLDAPVEVRVGDAGVGVLEPAPGSQEAWIERSVSVPASDGRRRVTLRADGPRRFDVFHYWLFGR